MSVRIAVVNASTVVSDADLTVMVRALQKQIQRDWYPVWGASASLVHIMQGHRPPSNAWWLGVFDDADQAGALGYHDITSTGLPLGKAFAKTAAADGVAISAVASHEMLEMLGDPDVNLLCQDGSIATRFWAYEVCDAVEADAVGYSIDGVPVSDFVFPSYFETFRTDGPFDHTGALHGPVPLLTPGGYMAYVENGQWNQVLADAGSAQARWRARPHEGSRRLRRMLGRSQRIPSRVDTA